MDPRKQITAHFDELSPELQRAAAFVLENEQELIILSMRAFAQKAEVKPATLLRLSQSLGYQGWNALKDDFIILNGLRETNKYTSKAKEILNHSVTQTSNIVYDEFFQSQIKNLVSTQEKNKDSFSKVVDTIDQSKNIYICGFRGSFPIAWSIFYVYKLFKKNITLIDGLAINLEMHMRDFSSEDTVLIVGFQPYSRETISILETAYEAGCQIVAITDSLISPLSKKSVATLLFSTDGPSFFPSISSGMSISENLLSALLAKHGQQAVDKVEFNENFLIKSGAYFNIK